jgi:hypothetical protein
MLLEPETLETLETVEADIHLVGTLLSLNNVIPKKTRETARKVDGDSHPQGRYCGLGSPARNCHAVAGCM